MSTDFSQLYSALNDSQKEAVDHIYWPMMVIAGPGTGKTQTLALRTARILESTDIPPHAILITTFTEAGVIALRKRLIRVLGNTGREVRVSTIHGLCQSILDTYRDDFADDRATVMIDDVDKRLLIESLLEKGAYQHIVSAKDTTYFIEDILSQISHLKREGITDERLLLAIDQEKVYLTERLDAYLTEHPRAKRESREAEIEKTLAKQRELAKVYSEYREALSTKKQYDYDDMIALVLARLQSSESLRMRVAEHTQMIMIDEFQDSNSAQNQIMDLIASVGDERNIVVVGDDDQSIYRFQGASVTNAFTFLAKYSDAKKVVLTDNYRSHQDILNHSMQLIEHNQMRLSAQDSSISKLLVARSTLVNPHVSARVYRDDLSEKGAITDTIRWLLDEQNTHEDEKEIAIIVRSNSEVDAWVSHLTGAGIIAENAGKSNVFKSPVVASLISALTVMNSPHEGSSALSDLMRSGVYQIDAQSIIAVHRALSSHNYQTRYPLSLLDIISDESTLTRALTPRGTNSIDQMSLESTSAVKGETLAEIHRLVADIYALSTSPYLSHISLLVRQVLKKMDFISLAQSLSLDSSEDLLFFISWCDAQSNTLGSLSALLERIHAMREWGIPLDRPRLIRQKWAIQVMTAHRSKGLEYDSVFMPSMSAERWEKTLKKNPLPLPHAITGDVSDLIFHLSEDDVTLEDTRRLVYVGMTRAKRLLALSYAQIDSGRERLESRFFGESGLTCEKSHYAATSEDIRISIGLSAEVVDRKQELLAYYDTWIETYRLSPSALNSFLESPKTFWDREVMKLPQEDMTSAWFGSAYHKALELWWKRLKEDGVREKSAFLIEKFTSALDAYRLTPDIRDQFIQDGSAGLTGWHDHWASIVSIPVLIESPFRYRKPSLESIPLTGSIDKVEWIDEGSRTVRIVDYKTSRAVGEKAIRDGEKQGYYRQLAFYALMCRLDREFSSQFTVSQVAIDFCAGRDEKYSVVPFEVTDAMIEEISEEIRQAWGKISSREYWRALL